MAQELTVDGKQYISSKRAAEVSGYAQDYIGQLSRKHLIDARRIGGLWYVQMDSLTAYKQEAEEYKPQPPAPVDRGNDVEAVVSFDGKEYVSAARASEITGYHQDYIGQLARGGTILSRQIGNRWYVDREGLLAHKQEKDAMLAAVQVESVGLQKRQPATAEAQERRQERKDPAAVIASGTTRYFQEEHPLLPSLEKEEPVDQVAVAEEKNQEEFDVDPEPTQISIRRIRTKTGDEVLAAQYEPQEARDTRKAPKTRFRMPIWAYASGALATIVIVLTVGYSSVKTSSTYTLSERFSNAAAAVGSGAVIQHIVDFIDSFIPELTYIRK